MSEAGFHPLLLVWPSDDGDGVDTARKKMTRMKEMNDSRVDGRTINEFRPINLRLGAVPRAVGSAAFSLKNTQCVAAVNGPTAYERGEFAMAAQLQCSVRLASFCRPIGRRAERSPFIGAEEREISASLTAALSSSIQLDRYPKSVISINVLVLQDDGGVLAAAVTCASLALADAGLLLYDVVAACSCATISDIVRLDCCADELAAASSETTVAHMTSLNQLTLLRHDGAAAFERTTETLQLALDGCSKLHARMQAVLAEKAKRAAVSLGTVGADPMTGEKRGRADLASESADAEKQADENSRMQLKS